MSSDGGITATSLRQDLSFNWVFLIELIVCGILTLFFLFYFNRVFATFVSYGIRAWTWHKYRVYIDIQALQISLLGGRIFFKGFRYHGNNETILIHSGFITWRYWFRNVRELDLEQDPGTESKRRASSDSEKIGGRSPAGTVHKAEGGGLSSSSDLPCRFNVSLKGVEWFVYNRSAAYDAIMTSMTEHAADNMHDRPDNKLRKRGGHPTISEKLDGSSKGPSLDSPLTERTTSGRNTMKDDPYKLSTSQSRSSEHSGQSTQGNLMLRFLPISLECTKAAIVLGNEYTKSVLITKADKVTGEIDATRPTPMDLYKQVFNFKFEHPVIQMKPNDDYKEDQSTAASKIKHGATENIGPKEPHIHSHSFLHRQRRKVLHSLQNLVPALRRSVESLSSTSSINQQAAQTGPGSSNWQGLARYLDESEQDEKAKWSSIEYATVSTIVDSPEATLSIYWDIPGPISHRGDAGDVSRGGYVDNVNGAVSPEWGVELSFKGAAINYGPWADRQRAEIQRVFFPSLCKDAVPSKKLLPGQLRMPTEFKLFIEFVDETTVRIPIREESKNWKWTKHADSMGERQEQGKRSADKSRKKKTDKGNPGPETRPFGWLDAKVSSNATVAYSMDMVADRSGFTNTLEIDLPDIELTTSVNHGVLWRSVDTRISCDLSNPLQWNGYHNWIFDIVSSKLELFLLREHVYLLIDLVDDWATGPPPEYLTFSPISYVVNLHLKDFNLYFNVNDSNIINNPSDMDDNTFLAIFGSDLRADICIPMDKYRPFRNDIPFNVDLQRGGWKLHVPPWNTQATFLPTTELAQLKAVVLRGTYQYCTTTSTSNTDTLLLDIHGYSPTAQFYGFVVRYFLKIKDNYFGDDIQFKTLEEYQNVLQARLNDDVEVVNTPPNKKSNDLDVVITVIVDDSNVILPCNLYSAKNHINIEVERITADIRFTNYYMDLDLVLSSLALSYGSDDDGTETQASDTSSTQLFVDGIHISGNRLFGLPPTEPTYVCNWDFAVGAITGECNTDFFSGLSAGARAFAFSFDDDENALPSISEVPLYDVTFLRASVDSIRLWLRMDSSAFLLSTGRIKVGFNDWAGTHYSIKLKLQIPDLRLSCVDVESALRHRQRAVHPVETHAVIQTSLSLGMIQRKFKFADVRQLQQEHIKRQDQRTHRADFLLHNELLDDSMLTTYDPPAMCSPALPPPIANDADLEKASQASKASSFSQARQFVRRKSSYLSLSSSIARSETNVVQPQSPQLAHDSRDARSHSLGAGLDRSAFLRDVSVSTGRHSSFYSAVGEHRGQPTANVTFSSSYLAPHYPLENVEPDLRDLPDVLLEQEDAATIRSRHLELDDVNPDGMDEDTTQVSFILELPSGVKGVFNPKAAYAVAELMTAMQALDPVNILDELQVDSMNDIFALNKQKIKTGIIVDFGLRTPGISLRFLNSTPSTQPSYSIQDTHDQYDVSMSGLALSFRSKTLPMEEPSTISTRKSSSVHFSLASLGLAAKERFDDLDDPQAAVNGLLEDVSFWTASGQDTAASLAFKLIELTTASSKVEYLASLVHRTNMLANTLEETFMSRVNQQRNRVRLFTYIVATAGQQIPDPLFLTRPSYVLRSAPDHLRASDSWKIVTRLHHIYSSLNSETRRDIAMRCLYNTDHLPEDAEQRVLAGFAQWRSWDLHNIDSCHVIRKIFRSVDQPATAQPIPFTVSFRTERVRLILDPGPKQNEVSVAAVTTKIVSKIVNSDPGVLSPPVGLQVQDTMVQVFCSDISVNLNWELCELADDILMLYHGSGPQQKSPIATSPSPIAQTSNIKHNLHVFVATTNGSISIETINLKVVSLSKGLTSSFILVNETEGSMPSTANLMLAAEAASSKIKSHSQELSTFQLRNPSVYASYEEQGHDRIPDNVIKGAGNCQELSLVIKQDVLALTEVLDLVIGDEITQLHNLKQSIPQTSTPVGKPADTVSTPLHIKTVNIALFLDQYHISVLLLPTLTYNVNGSVTRAAIAAQLSSEIVFDFDIKEHSHDVQTNINNKNESISLLQMPPTNGRITTHMSERENSVSVFTSVEPIKLDATAIHSLLIALNKPEISNVISDIQEEMKAVQAHIEDLFGRQQEPTLEKSPSARKPFIYNAHLTLTGFDIFANSQGANSDHSMARLDLQLGCIQLVLANRLEQQGPALTFPELRVSLRQIMIQLSRWHKKSMVPCGNLSFAVFVNATSKLNESGEEIRSYHLMSDALEINLLAETVSSVVDIVGNLQDKIKDLDLTREREYLRRLRKHKPRITINEEQKVGGVQNDVTASMFASMYSLELLNIQITWLVGTSEKSHPSGQEMENLVFSLKRIDLSTKRRHTARLTIEDLQVQMVPESHDKSQRSLNSALLPEIIFNVGYVSTANARRLAFQAAGKSLDLRLTSQLIIPASELQKSIGSAAQKVRVATASWIAATPEVTSEEPRRQTVFGNKRMESLLVDADFAGAVVYLSGRKTSDTSRVRGGRAPPQAGKYGQFTHTDASSNTVLRSPGLACKIEYKDSGIGEPSLNAEVKVDASSNILYPAVVPLVMEISSTVQDVVKDEELAKPLPERPSLQKTKSGTEENILTADPSTILGRTRLNLGIRICRQEFSLSCQPIARVAATSCFDDIYLTVNTVKSTDHGHFFAASATVKNLHTSVQHVYSRESTGSFNVDSVFLSLMNSKHVSGTSGVSAILKISPTKVLINAKQLQDFLLFREIWVPIEIRQARTTPVPTASAAQAQNVLVQRYQQVAATAAFPWNATVSVVELDVQIDLGQAIGKSTFMISNFWISSKKNSDWEQNLCLGFDKVGMDSTGRMSGFVALQDFKVRTSIQWPAREMALNQTPLVQGSMGFSQLRVKAAFDYQAFLVADITYFEFLMYNVRNGTLAKGDRLVAILNGEAVQVFCTATSASQGLALYQSFLRLAQEKKANYEASLTEIEKFMKRKSISQSVPSPPSKTRETFIDEDKTPKSPISLHTDVIVTLKAVNIGAFPNTFTDHQIFKLEALDAQARFAVMMDEGSIHSVLGLTLGQLRIGLAGVKTVEAPKSTEELSVEYVVASATGSRGGTILKVPKFEASMQTWQEPGSTHIDYIFKSSLEGKVEVGWNYSRISYIRGMWGAHSKALAQRLGKPLPISAVKITGVPDEEGAEGKDGEQQKITAEVNVPLSKYDYTALETPVIETPQLKDMGEATPPLEWIGLHRDRLPNLTHQIVIVTLLELASEVEDAYTKILGTS